MPETQKDILSNIKHDLELLKGLLRAIDKVSVEAKTKAVQKYTSEFDLSIADRLLSFAKGRLRDSGFDYQHLGEFYRDTTGKDFFNLSKSYLALFFVERNNFEEDFVSSCKDIESLQAESTIIDSEKEGVEA